MPTTLYGKGDGLKGDKVTFQCRDPHITGVTAGTSRDQIQQGSLEGTVFCVIDKQLRSLRKRVQHID